MERKKISAMSDQEAADALVMMEFSKMLRKARKAYERAQELENKVYIALGDMCIDEDAHSDAENAETLGDAVSCYLNYGEYDLKSLMREIKAQYTKEG